MGSFWARVVQPFVMGSATAIPLVRLAPRLERACLLALGAA